MRAMVLHAAGQRLRLEERPDPIPGRDELVIRVEACAVCRTDLHVIDGELAEQRLPIVPGHEIVGKVDRIGADVKDWRLGERVGVPWLAHTCGHCAYCKHGRENLCDSPLFTGYSRDGGFATHVAAEAAFCLRLDVPQDAVHAAPLLCAGLIGWRSLRMAGHGIRRLGLYGFGAAAHLIAQMAQHEGREVYAFTRPGDMTGQAFARSLGVVWAGGANERPPQSLDAAIILAPVGALVPLALQAVRKGGRVVCGGIHMSDIPSFSYDLLWEERELMSVANLTRDDAKEFLAFAGRVPLHVETTSY
ncbi:MAG TPA: zinc-dependent alcohol dehydrogenase family protein, partial [Caldimonas sp.]